VSVCTRCKQPDALPVAVGPEQYFACPTCAQPVRAHLTATPTISTAAFQTPFPVFSRGHAFKVYAAAEMWSPSWWSFLDEVETRELWWRINPGDVVLDVGADFGSYALSALAQGAAHVYAWSPPFKHPTLAVECETMARSAQLNGWGQRLTAISGGAWSTAGYLAAFDGPRMAEFFNTAEEAAARIAGEPGNCASFPVYPIDDYPYERVDFLKSDTEGAELEILRGASDTIARCRPRIMLEHHYHLDAKCEEKCDEFLLSRGYKKLGTRPHGQVAHSVYEP
jgi:FkbM family methyltransferase